MTRQPIRTRLLPHYTRGEEKFHMVTHIVGAGRGIIALVLCIVLAALHGNTAGIWTGAVFGVSMIALYTMSSVYHGLKDGVAKRVMQVFDHCTIYLLIAGTYTPLLVCGVRTISPVACWVNFAVVWAFAILGTTLTAIDLRHFRVFSMICYIGMGWSIIFSSSIAVGAGQRRLCAVAGGIFIRRAVFKELAKEKILPRRFMCLSACQPVPYSVRTVVRDERF